MERVETLCNLLTEKLANKASADEMLITVRMLESELLHIKKTTPAATATQSAALKISKLAESDLTDKDADTPAPPEEKTVEVLQVNEADIEAELEEIKKNAAEINRVSLHNPSVAFDPMDDIPTLAGRGPLPPEADKMPTDDISEGSVQTANEIKNTPPVNTPPVQNEPFRKPEREPEIPDGTPVKDLKKAINADERSDFINELFRGDEAMYERSIKTINSFAIYPEAEYWIRRELKLKIGWEDRNETVRRFDQMVRRRFA